MARYCKCLCSASIIWWEPANIIYDSRLPTESLSFYNYLTRIRRLNDHEVIDFRSVLAVCHRIRLTVNSVTFPLAFCRQNLYIPCEIYSWQIGCLNIFMTELYVNDGTRKWTKIRVTESISKVKCRNSLLIIIIVHTGRVIVIMINSLRRWDTGMLSSASL